MTQFLLNSDVEDFPSSNSVLRDHLVLHFKCIAAVAEWLRRSVLNHARSTRVGSNPIVGATNYKPTVNSAVHPSEVGK